MGGLNYQIEHHLPGVAARTWSRPAPSSGRLCQEHGIAYDEVPIHRAWKIVIDYVIRCASRRAISMSPVRLPVSCAENQSAAAADNPVASCRHRMIFAALPTPGIESLCSSEACRLPLSAPLRSVRRSGALLTRSAQFGGNQFGQLLRSIAADLDVNAVRGEELQIAVRPAPPNRRRRNSLSRHSSRGSCRCCPLSSCTVAVVRHDHHAFPVGEFDEPVDCSVENAPLVPSSKTTESRSRFSATSACTTDSPASTSPPTTTSIEMPGSRARRFGSAATVAVADSRHILAGGRMPPWPSTSLETEA